jgi:hypothetical protein
MRYLAVTFLLVALHNGNYLLAAEPPANKRLRFENASLRVSMVPRSPEQMAAFYEARKFPVAMIERLKKECFITVGIHNKTNDILWLELDNWAFSTSGKPLKRYHRNEWRNVWKSLAVPMASQSTFRWTLLPEILDFRPDEREGGNIILQRTDKAIRVSARFRTGADKSGKAVEIQLDKLFCSGDAQ